MAASLRYRQANSAWPIARAASACFRGPARYEDFIPQSDLLMRAMPSSDPLTVSLTPELRLFIQAQVASGRYQTASEVVRAGLRLLTKVDPPLQLNADVTAPKQPVHRS